MKETIKLKVIRPFQHMGAHKSPGDTIHAPRWSASKLLSYGNVRLFETASIKPPETAQMPLIEEKEEVRVEVKPEVKSEEKEPKHIGGGWYLLPDGTKRRKADLEDD